MKNLHIVSSACVLVVSSFVHAQVEVTPEAYALWSEYYQIENNDLEKANEILQKLSLKTPQDSKVWKTWAYLELRKKNNSQALTYIDRALTLNPEDEELLLQKAYLLNAAQRDPEALEIFKRLQYSSNRLCCTNLSVKGFSAI